MARMEDVFDYKTGGFAAVRDAAKEATGAYQDAARGLDTLKEWVLIEMGMPNTAEAIHALAHEQPKRFDRLGDILHQRHIMQLYPATAEYTVRPEDLDGVFEQVIGLLERIEAALRLCVQRADENGLYALGRAFENLEMENSASYEKFMYAWQMYSRNDMSATSFENWIARLFDTKGGGGDADGDESR